LRITSVAGLAGGGSVTSTELSAVSAQAASAINVVSAAVNVVSNAVSNEISNRISADNALSVRIDTQSQSISALSHNVSTLSQAVSVADAALSLRITSVAGLAGGGSVTSTELSAVSATAATANNVLSQQISTLSQQQSVQNVSIAVLSNKISLIVSAPVTETTGAPVTRRVIVSAGAQATVSAATMTNISGLSISVTAGGVYKLEAMLLVNRGTAAQVMGYGLTFPAMNKVRGVIYTNVSVQQAPTGLSTTAIIYPFNGDSASGSVLVSTISMAQISCIVKYDAVMVVSTTGVVHLQMKAGATTGAGIALQGSYIQVLRMA
jgi:hypothetical protein